MAASSRYRAITYVPSPLSRTLRAVARKIVGVSLPRTRKRISAFGLRLDRVVDRLGRKPDKRASYALLGSLHRNIKTFMVNGRRTPCVVSQDLDNSVLGSKGIVYKRYRAYKFWHSPLDQFALLEKLYRAEPRIMVKPLCIVLDRRRKPIGFLMEGVSGRSLDDLIRSNALSHSDSLKIEKTVRNFIKRAHAKKLSHGDLNTSNIMIDEKSAVKLIDPLELMPGEKALSDDFAWLDYLRKQLGLKDRGRSKKTQPHTGLKR